MWQSYETLKPVAEPVPAVLRHKQSKPRKISSLHTKYLLERILFEFLISLFTSIFDAETSRMP